MKHIFTLLISLGAFATSFAQYNPGPRDDRYAYNQGSHFRDNFSPRDKEFQVEKINREFDFRIYAIKNNWNLGRHQKKVAIRNLERERATQIQIVNAGFHHRRKGYDRDDDNHWNNR